MSVLLPRFTILLLLRVCVVGFKVRGNAITRRPDERVPHRPAVLNTVEDLEVDVEGDDEFESMFVQDDLQYLDVLKNVVKAAQNSGAGSGKKHGKCRGGWTQGPVIVGGLSDSGTRGAKSILSSFMGIKMQNVSVGKCGDDTIINDEIERFWHTFIKEVGAISDVAYLKARGFADVADSLCQAVKTSWQLAGSPSGSWGFKSPRSILVTPVWNYLFGANYRFVHVVRDPRANCAKGANKKQYQKVCKSFLNKRNCKKPLGCLNYWSRVNGDVQNMFASDGRAAQYVFLSMDRLVLPELAADSACVTMVKREFAKLQDGVDDTVATNICTAEHAFGDAYKPLSYSADQAQTMVERFREAAVLDPRVVEVAARMGYSSSAWAIEPSYGLV